MYFQDVKRKTNLKKKIVFCWHLEKNENRRIRIRIRIHQSKAWICGSISGSGSNPKGHGSATLTITNNFGKIFSYLFHPCHYIVNKDYGTVLNQIKSLVRIISSRKYYVYFSKLLPLQFKLVLASSIQPQNLKAVRSCFNALYQLLMFH